MTPAHPWIVGQLSCSLLSFFLLNAQRFSIHSVQWFHSALFFLSELFIQTPTMTNSNSAQDNHYNERHRCRSIQYSDFIQCYSSFIQRFHFSSLLDTDNDRRRSVTTSDHDKESPIKEKTCWNHLWHQTPTTSSIWRERDQKKLLQRSIPKIDSERETRTIDRFYLQLSLQFFDYDKRFQPIPKIDSEREQES